MARRWGRPRPAKMGYEASGSSPRRNVDERATVAGVEFSHSRITGWSCLLCGALTDVPGMSRHAREHRPEEVARAEALARATAALAGLGAAELDELVELLPVVRANRAGFAALVDALTGGERKHPGRGPGPSPDQDVGDHLAALGRHAARAQWRDAGVPGPGLEIDDDTLLPHAALAAARGVLAVQLAEERRR